ncbi:MAG: hypothetical protein L0H73_10330 [Nitrococcus sp.]|nr:hypothetical protein [Nitrococcus sp.]
MATVQAAGHAQTRGPEDQPQIRPHARILMGEHHDLHAVIWHAFIQPLVRGHHGLPETLAAAADCKSAAAIGGIIKDRFQRGGDPSQEKLRELMIVDCIRIRRVGDPEIALGSQVSRIRYFCCYVDCERLMMWI